MRPGAVSLVTLPPRLTGPSHPASHAPQARDGLDTVDANRALGLPDEARNYDVVPFILRDLGATGRRTRTLTLTLTLTLVGPA